MQGKRATLASWGWHGLFAPLNPPMSHSGPTLQAILLQADKNGQLDDLSATVSEM